MDSIVKLVFSFSNCVTDLFASLGFDPVIGKTVTAKYAGNLYHEIQHDNGDRYVVKILVGRRVAQLEVSLRFS